MNKLFVIILLVAQGLPLWSQNILKLTVLDESEQVLPDVNVKILNTDSAFISGGVTDQEGLFSCKDVKVGKYILVASYIGYANLFFDIEMPNSNLNLDSVKLQPDKIMLNAVTITASNYIQKKDHLLVIPDKQQIKHSFSGYDLLYNLMIPGLKVDKKSKTVETMAGTAVLYINGVKSDMREIGNLQPKEVERVEYYIMPTSGQFSGDPASINYITKVYTTGGYVTLDGEQTIGYLKGDYNVGAKMMHNNTSYTLFGGYGMKDYDGIKIEKNEVLYFPDQTIERSTTNDGAKYKNNQQYAQLKVSNDTKKRNLSAAASLVSNNIPDNDRSEILSYSGNEGHTIQSYEANNNKSTAAAIHLNGVFNVSNRKQWVTRLNGAYTQNAYNRIYTEGDRKSLTDANEDLYSFDAQVAYRYQPNDKNSLYGRVTHFHNITSTSYKGDYSSWQHLWKGESLFQLDYTHNFSERTAMMLSPGVSWVNYKLHGSVLNSIWNLRANCWVRHLINKKQWAGLGFSIGNSQPNISYLNTANQTIDFYMIKRGNPYLDNPVLYQIYSMYEGQLHKLFSLQGKFWLTKDVHNISSNYYVEDSNLISSYLSDKSFNSANLEVSVSSRPFSNLSTNIGLKYSYMYVPGMASLKQNNYVISFDVNYFIKSFSINAYAKTKDEILNKESLAYVSVPASYGFSVRYSGKNWMAECGSENPFTKQVYYREHADYGVYKYNQALSSRIYQQTAYIKLAYTFDFGKKTSRESNNMDRNIKSAILKAE